MGFIGFSEVQAALTRLEVKADLATRTIVSKSAALVEQAAKKNFDGAHRKGEPHSGGDLPNVVSGALRRSIRSTPVGRTGVASYVASVGPTAVYGRRVELGFNGSRGYPFFNPAVAAVRPKLRGLAAEVWAAVL